MLISQQSILYNALYCNIKDVDITIFFLKDTLRYRTISCNLKQVKMLIL